MTSNYAIQAQFMREFCDFLIPGDSIREIPSFSELGLIEDFLGKCDLNSILSIQSIHREIIQSDFQSGHLDKEELKSSFNFLLTNFSVELMSILTELLSLYYSNKKVIASMDLNSSLPFPKGLHLDEMDFDLLIPVFTQSQSYKKI